MNGGFEATAYKRRGDVVADVEGAVERFRIACADCADVPVIASIYAAPSGAFVQALRYAHWPRPDPGELWDISGVPTFMWVPVPVPPAGDRLPLTCRCRQHDSVLWSDVLKRIRSRPLAKTIRVHRGGQLAMYYRSRTRLLARPLRGNPAGEHGTPRGVFPCPPNANRSAATAA